MIKELTELDLKDIIKGCTILGTGGGGDPEEGLKIVKREFDRGGKFLLTGLDEISDDATMASPYCVGSLTSNEVRSVYDGSQRIFPIAECIRSFELLEEYTGKKFFATVATEIGEMKGWKREVRDERELSRDNESGRALKGSGV